MLKLALLTGLLIFVPPRDVGAHQDPGGCGGTGLTLILNVYFADGVTSPGAGGFVTECETLLYQGFLAYPGGNVCAFQGGTLTITTPDGMAHNVTPGGGVPKLGGTGGVPSVLSQTVMYMVRPQDVVGGTILASLSYTGATAHTGPGTTDTNGVPTGSTAVPNTVTNCPTGTECATIACDKTATQGSCPSGTCTAGPPEVMGNPCTTDDDCSAAGVRQGLCVTTNVADSTTCTDNDGNACTTAGCNGQGSCDQNHITTPCPPDTNECTDDLPCDTQTGLCPHPPKTDSTPCPDTDVNACTTAGCNGAGVCDQNHVTTPCPPDTNECTDDLPCDTQTGLCPHPPKTDSTPCTDIDLNACTTAGCNGQGTCDQNHQTTTCPPDTNECTDDLPCDTQTGACPHPNKPDSTPCTDSDQSACTTAGCNGSGVCDQSHQQVVCNDPTCERCDPANGMCSPKDPLPAACGPLNHFLCYEVHEHAKNITGIGVVDQFGPSTLKVVKQKRICAPADKNDEDPTAPTDPDHLTVYTVKQTPRFPKFRGVTVVNQFGTATMDLVRADALLVPTAKGLGSPPAPLTATIDHFKCYALAKGPAPNVTVKVDTQFGSINVLVKKARRLCGPADKMGEGIHDDVTHLLCYTVRLPTGTPPFRGPENVFLDDQFGQTPVPRVFAPRELCVPSLKHLP